MQVMCNFVFGDIDKSTTTITATLPTMDDQMRARWECLMAPLDEEKVGIITEEALPDTFALFEHDARQIFSDEIPEELRRVMRPKDLGHIEGFERCIPNEDALQAYLRLRKMAFFLDGALRLKCKIINGRRRSLNDAMITIRSPKHSCFATAEEIELLQNGRDKYLDIVAPLQAARRELRLSQRHRTHERMTVEDPSRYSLPVLSSRCGVKIKKGTVYLSAGKLCIDEEMGFDLYLIPMAEGEEHVSVFYEHDGGDSISRGIDIRVDRHLPPH